MRSKSDASQSGMETAVERFLRFMQVEKAASELTLKSYREDLLLLMEFFEEANGRVLAPAEVTPLDLRAFVASLHESGYAKSSIARRLACMRSFFRFAQRVLRTLMGRFYCAGFRA